MKDKWLFTAGILLLVTALYILVDIDSMFAVVVLLAVAGAALVARAQ